MQPYRKSFMIPTFVLIVVVLFMSEEASGNSSTSSTQKAHPNSLSCWRGTNANFVESVIGIDEYGRRFFPQEQESRDGYVSHAPVPDCTLFSGKAGCVVVPSSMRPKAAYPWIGTLFTKHPKCDIDPTTKTKTCDDGIPSSERIHSSTERYMIPVDQHFFNPEVSHLPGGALHAYSVAIADFNNDGYFDVVLGNVKEKNQLLINDGNGSFNTAIDLPGGTEETNSIIAADLNNDNMMDIIIGNYRARNIILMNYDNGTFSDVIYLPDSPTSHTTSLAAADVNGDEMVDIVVGNKGDQNQLLTNKGNGTFEVLNLGQGKSLTTAIAIADITGNGYVDVIVGNYAESNELIINGRNGFSQIGVKLPSSEQQTLSVAVGDLNNDSTIDMVFGNNRGQRDQILINNGTDIFESIHLPGSNESALQSTVVFDVDQNGSLDIVAGTSANYQNLIYFLNNTENVAVQKTVSLGDSGSSTYAVGAYLNQNGMVALVFANNNAGNELFYQDKDGHFPGGVELTGGIVASRVVFLAAADFNNDGFVDIVVGNYGKRNQILLNDGYGKYLSATDLPGGERNTMSIAIADVNNDNAVDIIVGNAYQHNQLLMNDGLGNFPNVVDLPGDALLTTSVAVMDVKNDGNLDILIGNYNAANYVLINEGDGTFINDKILPLPGDVSLKTNSVAAADLNDDGYGDFIIGNRGQKNHLLFGNAQGNFEVVELSDDEFTTRSIAVADMDGENGTDIIIGNDNGINQIFFNDGCGNFMKTIKLYTDKSDRSGHTTSIAVADFNNDGRLDLVFGDYRQQLFLNKGDNYFLDTSGGIINSLFDATSVIPVDVNNDKRIDLIMGNAQGQNKVILNQETEPYFEVNDLPGDELSRSVSIAISDVNDDGTLSFFIANFGQNFQLLTHDIEAETFKSSYVPSFDGVRVVVSADFDNDGLDDVIAGCTNGPNYIFMNHEDQDAKFKTYKVLPGGSSDTRAMAVADIDGDGFMDVIIGNWMKSNIVLKNDRDGGFHSPLDLPGLSLSHTQAIAVADVNGDNAVDIIVVNQRQTHQVLINDGFGNFDTVIDLPNAIQATTTTSIAVGDMNNDGRVDIVLGNDGQSNQILRNKGNSIFELSDILPYDDSNTNTFSIAVADMNGDSMLDIIVGNNGQSNQILMNHENGNFHDAGSIPGSEDLDTYSIAIADVNKDGYLEIITCNLMQKNQIVSTRFDSCHNGGAKIHSLSWCYQCPPFMGKQSQFLSGSKCMECQSDYMQNQLGDGERCGQFCALKTRPIGFDECTMCPDGHYYDNSVVRNESDPFTWKTDRCISCGKGVYANSSDIFAVDSCFKCKPGTYQNQTASSKCFRCPSGTYQPNFGGADCEVCPKGGYCKYPNEINGGFVKCQSGFYNEKTGQSDNSSCLPCPSGKYNPKTGSTSSTSCRSCPSGMYNDLTGQSVCKPCEKGQFQSLDGQPSCQKCPNGTYADNTGLKKCIDCPYRLTSTNGAERCSMCSRDFYLKNINATAAQILQTPSEYCLPCPSNVDCPPNTNIHNLTIHLNTWRHSSNTEKVYPCRTNGTCVGSLKNITKMSSQEGFSTIYCLDGHKGPLCEVCVDREKYYNVKVKQCSTCPSSLNVILQVCGLVIAMMIVLCIVLTCYRKKALDFMSALGLQAKSKLLVSFYQIIVSLDDVYGVRLSPQLLGWINFFKYIGLDIIDFASLNCVGTVKLQLIIKTMWPFMIILIAFSTILFYNAFLKVCQGNLFMQKLTRNASIVNKNIMVQGLIIVIYFAFPLAVRGLFDVFRCKPFKTDDNPNNPKSYASYLLMDLNHTCDATDEAYGSLLVLFWAIFAIWMIIIPCGFYTMLRRASESIQSNSITGLANYCRFLWEDYNASAWYWDLTDIARKVFLTGLIMFIDRREGSNKVIRLIVAIVVSILFLCVLLAFHPYKRSDNYITALVTNFILICCFTLGILLKLCDQEDGKLETCKTFIGKGFDSYNASTFVVILTLGMLVLNIGSIAFLSAKSFGISTVSVKSTGHKPVLELDSSCSHHLFMSHVWCTGQAQTHAIVRQLQLLLPGIKIWLDVDELEDVADLESCIKTSAMFVLFYSNHYFESKNCRREIYAAVSSGKPIIVLYEGDESVLDDLKQQCFLYCEDFIHETQDGLMHGGDAIIQNIFENESWHNDDNLIMWLKEGNHSAAALERIHLMLLKHLPHYRNHPHELDRGIFVPGELPPVHLQSSINIMIHGKDEGSRKLARELLATQSLRRRRRTVRVLDSFNESRSSTSNKIIDYESNLLIGDDDDSESNNDEEREALTDVGYQQPLNKDNPTYFLLYLNRNTFLYHNDEDREKFIRMIKRCMDSSIKIVLVHEKDLSKGGCEFDVFLSQAPKEIIRPPIKLFNQIAIPLYTRMEYRRVSLRQILCKMGAVPAGKKKR